MISPLVLLAITVIIFLVPTDRAILDDGDALYTHIAQEMVQRGDWTTPFANGVRFLDKPPFPFWMMAASFKVLGISERSARLPSALAIFATSLILLLLVRQIASEFAGLMTGLAFLLSPGTRFFTFEAFPDIYLVLFLTLCVFSLLACVRDGRNQRWAIPLFFISMALAVLTKSLIGIVFPLAIVIVFLLVSRERPGIQMKYVAIGMVAFLVIAIPWHVVAAQRNPGFLNQYFVNEQLLRFIGRRQPVDYGSIPIPLFWLLLFVWSFPWSIFLAAFPRFLFQGPSRHLVIASVCWIAVVMGFFTISSRLEHYSFPALPPIAILSVLAMTSTAPSRALSRCFAFLAGIGGGWAVATLALLAWINTGRITSGDPSIPTHDRAYTNLFSPLFDLPQRFQSELRIPLLLTLAVIAIGFVTTWWFYRKEMRRASLRALAVTMLCFLIIAVLSLRICDPLLSSRQFGLALKQIAHPGEKVVVFGDFETANSTNFYAPAVRLLMFGGGAPSIEAGLRFPDAPKLIIDSTDLNALWKSNERVYALGPSAKIREAKLSPEHDILESDGRLLISNQGF